MNFFLPLSSKIKHKRFNKKSQGWSCENPIPLREICINPEEYFRRKLTGGERELLNFLMVWENSFRVLYFAQQTIADSLGLTRETVNRMIAKLKRLGLIGVNYRGKQSCEYRVSKWFRDIKIRTALSGIFSAFLTFPVMLFSQNVTQVISFSKTSINNNITLTSDSAREVKLSRRETLPLEKRVKLVSRRDALLESFKKAKSFASLVATCLVKKVESYQNKHMSQYKHSPNLPPDDPWQEERKPFKKPIQQTINAPRPYQPTRRYETMSREESIRLKAKSDDRSEALQSVRGKDHVWRKTFAQQWVIAKDGEAQ